FPELISRIAPPSMRTWWFAEMIDVRAPVSAAAVARELQLSLGPQAHAGLAPHAPFTASLQLYRDAARQNLLLSTHLAESREEMLMFRDGRGPLFEFLQQLGRRMDDCGRETPLARLLSAGVLDKRWIVAHLNELTSEDFQLLEAAPRFHIAHCPGSHAYFQHTPFAYAELRRLGFNISLGTDSLASNHDLSLFTEMRQFRQQHPSVTAREMLEMITVNPAAALRQGDRLGRIRAGFAADFVAVPSDSAADDVFEDVLAHSGKVSWSMIAGSRRE
ncbi:MAG: amidohydrolase family protein, partial [Verrucomicrobiota bacterium]|nr:amidohydrolase family protein [Verrucomicrobiota bacterium]